MSSREQLMLEAVRRHFRRCGMSPSYRELAIAVGMLPQHVGKTLAGLATDGLLTYERGVPRSIILADRTANLSDTEMELAMIARGYTVTRSTVPVLVDAYPLPITVPVTECGMAQPRELADLIGKLQEVETGGEVETGARRREAQEFEHDDEAEAYLPDGQHRAADARDASSGDVRSHPGNDRDGFADGHGVSPPRFVRKHV